MTKTSENRSLKEEVELYGVIIKKLPNEDYFEALELLKKLPKTFIDELFEGNKDFKLSEMLNMSNITELIIKLINILPDFSMTFISKLIKIDEDIVRNKLTPVQTLKIVKKFWELNELSDFFQEMKSMVKSLTEIIGFKEQ